MQMIKLDNIINIVYLKPIVNHCYKLKILLIY